MLGPPGPAFEEAKYPLLELMIRAGARHARRPNRPESLRSHQRSGNLSGGLRAVARRRARRPGLNLYADSSAILAWLLGEAGRAERDRSSLARAHVIVCSHLTLVECDRALLRRRAEGRARRDAMRAELSARVSAAASDWTRLAITETVLDRARLPFAGGPGPHARRHPPRERARGSSAVPGTSPSSRSTIGCVRRRGPWGSTSLPA